METSKILSADVLDIIFDEKNKMYGAYELRKTYNKRMVKAIMVTSAFAGMLILLQSFVNNNDKKIAVLDYEDNRFGKIPPVEKPMMPPPPPPPVQKLVEPVNQKRFVTPVIVATPLAKDEVIETLPDDVGIGTKTIKSDNNTIVAFEPVTDPGTNIIETPKVDKEDTIFRSVQIEAEFPGGSPAWQRYLQQKIDVNAAGNNGAGNGTYRVIVNFIVSKDGSISNVKAETAYGFGLEEQAVRAIQNGPKWKPAVQNGRNVNAYRRQPITFVVEE